MKKLTIVILSYTNLIFAADLYGGAVEVQVGSANSSAFASGVINSQAIRVDGLVKINPYMGVEAGFTGLTKPASKSEQSSALQFYDASFKAVLPTKDNLLNIHVQTGIAYAMGTVVPSGTDATYKILVGVGVDLNLSQNFTITANNYDYLNYDLNPGSGVGGNTNVLMAGLKYNF